MPSVLLADKPLKTGYDLYHNIKLMDNPQTPEQISEVIYTTGYLSGYLDALALGQRTLFEGMFPSTHFSERIADIRQPKGAKTDEQQTHHAIHRKRLEKRSRLRK
jgi:cytoskeletal protein RodZ